MPSEALDENGGLMFMILRSDGKNERWKCDGDTCQFGFAIDGCQKNEQIDCGGVDVAGHEDASN